MWNGQLEDPSGSQPQAAADTAADVSAARQPTPLEVVGSHEMRRRRRLVRIVTISVIVPIVLLVPSAMFPSLDLASLAALIAALVCTCAAYFLNRMGLVNGAGL